MTKTDLVVEADQSAFFAPPDVPDSFKKAIGVVQVAMGKLGFLHRKLYNVMLANAYEGLGEGRTQFSIPASMMAELAGFDSNNYQVIYDHCRELMQTEVLTVDFDKRQKGRGRGNRRRGGTTLVADFDVIEGGTITYSFSPKMAQLLHEPEQYIWMALSAQSKFSSKYELSLFENCIRYIGVQTTGFKDVEDWRAVLGADDPTYDQFKDFNKKVLKPAIQGVNSKSGIIVDPEFEREKRRVARIKFNVREDPQLSLLEYRAHSRIRETEAYKAVRELGLQDVIAVHYIETKGEAAVLEAVAYVRDKKPKNPTGYLVHALKSGYGEKTPEERRKAAEGRAKAEELKAAREAKAAAERAEEALQRRFKAHQDIRYPALLAEQGEPELERFGGIVKEALPQHRAFLKRWDEVGQDYRKLDSDNMTDGGILRYVRMEALKRWGAKADHDLEAFRQLESLEEPRSGRAE